MKKSVNKKKKTKKKATKKKASKTDYWPTIGGNCLYCGYPGSMGGCCARESYGHRG